MTIAFLVFSLLVSMFHGVVATNVFGVETTGKSKAWKLPASDLLYVGRSTNQKLCRLGIKTIGDLAETDESILQSQLGKMGSILWAFANGYDDSPVKVENTRAPIKSVGNSTTTPRDLENDEDVDSIFHNKK